MEKKVVKKYIGKIVLFIAIFLVIFVFLTDLLKDKRFSLPYDVSNKVNGFYNEPKDTMDFVFVGSSEMFFSMNPMVLWNDAGITSYDFAASEQPLWISYSYIQEALKYQHPKAIVLDVAYSYFPDEYATEGVNRIDSDDIKFSQNKINMIEASVPADQRITFYIEMLKYHSNWENLNGDHFQYLFWPYTDPFKGFTYQPVVKQYTDELDPDCSETTDKLPIPSKSLEYLNKIIDYTKQNNINLILIKTPECDSDLQPIYNSVADLAKEKDVPFINFNTIMPGTDHPDHELAERITKYMEKYLVANFTLTDHRNDPAIAAEWSSDYQEYQKQSDELLLHGFPNQNDDDN